MEMLVLLAAILKKKIRVVDNGEDEKDVKDKVSDHVWGASEGHGTWTQLPPSDGMAAAGHVLFR